MRAGCVGTFSLPSTNASYMTTLAVASVKSLLCQALTCYSHRLEVALHAINANRNTIDQ